MRPQIFYVSTVLAAVVFCAVVIPIALKRDIAVHEAVAKETYAAWCKYTHRTDLTIQEWSILKRQGLLSP